MFFLANQGYRVIGHDRRGHGRSSQPWDNNNMDAYTNDLCELMEKLGLTNAMMVGHSTDGGEVVRVLCRHGTSRVSKAVLVGAVSPHLVSGVPLSTFDSFREAMIQDRSKFFIDVPSGPFFGFNRPNAIVSQGKIWSWWQQSMTAGFKTLAIASRPSPKRTSLRTCRASIFRSLCFTVMMIRSYLLMSARGRRPSFSRRGL